MVSQQPTPCKRHPGLVLACWLLPNTQQFFRRYRPALLVARSVDVLALPDRRWWHWRPTIPWRRLHPRPAARHRPQFDKLSEFIYFQF